MNIFCGMGRLTRDPEMRETDSGYKVCNFSIAINRDFKNKNGEYEADFINCVAFDRRAEFVNQYFGKGSMVGITGRLQIRKWDKDGETRYATEIVVNSVSFAESKKESYTKQEVTEPEHEEVENLSDDDLPF